MLTDILQRDWPFQTWKGERLLLAVSGGADSTALLRAIHQLSPRRDLMYAAHFNHGWRGAESDEDEAFVRELCRSLGVELTVGSSLTHGIPQVGAISDNSEAIATRRSEESARKLRYQFLTATARRLGATLILTAHTGSDRVETMLHHLCRGTGLPGICTPTLIRPHRGQLKLVRPLIHCFRHQVEEYLFEIHQDYRQDSSNRDQTFRRNFMRSTVLPMLRQQYGSQLDQRLLSFSQIVEETVQTLSSLAEQYWKDALRLKESQANERWLSSGSEKAICLPSFELLPTTWTIVRQALQTEWHQRGWSLQAMTRRHWDRIREVWEHASDIARDASPTNLSKGGRARSILPGRVTLSFSRGWIILEPFEPNSQ